MTADQEAIFQKMINTMYERFLTVVSGSRKAFDSNDKLKPIADGRIYTASEAHSNGLIDGVKYMDEVIDKIKKAAISVKVTPISGAFANCPFLCASAIFLPVGGSVFELLSTSAIRVSAQLVVIG